MAKPPVDKNALEAVGTCDCDTCDWRKLLETEEEWAKRIDEEYVVDEKTGDILARRLTPYELALLAGHDWYKEAEELSDDDYIMRDLRDLDPDAVPGGREEPA